MDYLVDSDHNLISRIEGNLTPNSFLEGHNFSEFNKNFLEHSRKYFIGIFPSKTLKYFSVKVYLADMLASVIPSESQDNQTRTKMRHKILRK